MRIPPAFLIDPLGLPSAYLEITPPTLLLGLAATAYVAVSWPIVVSAAEQQHMPAKLPLGATLATPASGANTSVSTVISGESFFLAPIPDTVIEREYEPSPATRAALDQR